MRELLRRLLVPLTLALLIIVPLATMLLDRRSRSAPERAGAPWSGFVLELAVPIQKMMAAPVDLVRDGWRGYVDLRDVREENTTLRRELLALREENLQYREALVASGRLARIAAMRDQVPTRMLPAEVVGLDVSPWFRSLLVDRGGRDGVRAGMPVVTDGGVVGLVTAVSRGAARTMLLLDRQSAIDGIVQRSRARGIVRGSGRDRLEFEFVVRGADVRPGDVVITSGLGGAYPKGLRVGEILAVPEVGDADLVQKAELQPAVDLGRLEQVFVMLWRGPAMGLLYGDEAPGEASPAASRADPPPDIGAPGD